MEQLPELPMEGEDEGVTIIQPSVMVVDVDVGAGVSHAGINVERVQKFRSWRRKIVPLFQVLAKVPRSKLENALCSSENAVDEEMYNEVLKCENVIKDCEELYEKLTKEVDTKREEAQEKWIKMQCMWEELRDKEEVKLTFTYAETGVITAIDALISQLELRQKEKSLRLKEFIKELRHEISAIWDKCMITDEEKSAFKEFYIEEFTERMLDIHTNELKRWQIYHKKNQEILVKIKKREEMWTQLKDLEARASDPNRFVNRGGALLKDQTLHNQITKNLPKLEAELVKLAEMFEKEHGRKMTILGKQIPSMIEEEWQKFKAEKAERKQDKVNQEPSNASHPSKCNVTITKPSLMKSRISIMPTPNSRHVEKRPAPKSTSNRSPLKKCPKLSSLDSVTSNESEKN